MARQMRHSAITNRTARERLAPGGKVHWRDLVPGKIALGYRRRKAGQQGEWLKRVYLGANERGGGRYQQFRIGKADDFDDPNGASVLDYAQAQELALGKAKPSGPLTVAMAMEDYIAFLDSAGKPTRDARGRADTHILPALGSKLVSDLVAQDIRDWHASLVKAAPLVRNKKGKERVAKAVNLNDPETKRRRQSTANRTLTVLKAALNFAYDEQKVTTNDGWGRRVKPFKGVDGVRSRYLTIEEAQRLVNGCAPDFRLLVRGALETGARYAELTRLKVSDFHDNSGTIYIRQSKSGKTRDIILSPSGVEFFRKIVLGRDGDELMFKNQARIERSRERGDNNDTGEWRASEQARPMMDAVERAKIKPAISFHGLRHTWASHAVMNETDLIVVAKNLGHRDTMMVQKHYGHLAPSYVVDAIRAGAPVYNFDNDASNVRPLRKKSKLSTGLK